MADALVSGAAGETCGQTEEISALWDKATARMSEIGGAIRDAQSIRGGLEATRELLAGFPR